MEWIRDNILSLISIILTLFLGGSLAIGKINKKSRDTQKPIVKGGSVVGKTENTQMDDSFKIGDDANNPTLGQTVHQYNNCSIQQGITEERARKISEEITNKVLLEYTKDANDTIVKRMGEFRGTLIPRIEKVENGLEAFKDLGFQSSLFDVQKAAAVTGRSADYELLSELLVRRIEIGEDRYEQAVLRRAVSIVEDISDEALIGLTASSLVNCLIPDGHDADSVFQELNTIFGSIYGELPMGDRWIGNLHTVGALEIAYFAANKSLEEIYEHRLDGICVAGIQMEMVGYDQARAILQNCGLDPNECLIKNTLLEGYVRLGIGRIEEIDNYKRLDIELSDEQKVALKAVLALYDKNMASIQQVRNAFAEKLMQYPNLKKLKKWWDSMPIAFNLTMTGKVLGLINARRYNNDLPIPQLG